jgi:hypothetical protein
MTAWIDDGIIYTRRKSCMKEEIMNKKNVMKLTVWLITLFMFSVPAFSEKVGELPEIMNPQVISVGAENLYVSEKTTVYVYSLQDYKLKHKFGTAGEGPGEFKQYAFVVPTPDALLINSQGRISYFSRQGEYIKETKSQVGFIGGAFMPLGKNFAGQGFTVVDQKFYKTFNLYDSKLAKIKEVYRYHVVRSQSKINPLSVRLYRFDCKSYKDKFYAGNDAEGIIKVFDPDGKEIRTIRYPFKELEVTREQINEMLAHYQINPDTKTAYARLKDRIEFPKFYPRFYDFFADDFLYVLTFKRQENQAEFIVFDDNGKFVKKIMVPFYQTNMHVTYPHNIRGGKLYQVVENEDDELWELHVSAMN